MVKSVAGEETRLKSAEDRLSRSSITAEVGIIIGKLSLHLERGFVYDLIPTPPTDGGGPACSLKFDTGGWDGRKKGSKGGKASAEAIPSLLIDGEWVAEHARQVSRMLLGGMSVIGIYVWSSEASFKATSASALSQAVRVVAQATPSFESETNERLLIHISHSPKRWACRNCAITSVDLRPCDFKMSKLLPTLQTYRCMYGFDIRIPVDVVSTSNTFKNVLRSGISRHARDLQSARALFDGKLVAENQQVTSDGLHNVELLLPFKGDAQHGSSGDVAGLLVFRGAICAYAYLNPKEPASQAISDLKNDIINSLKGRLDLVFEEGEGTLDMASNDLGKESDEMVSGKPIHQLILHELRKPLVLSFPRRVLVPWLSGTFICDYLLSSETFEDVKDRCRELLSMEAPAESIGLLELETEAEPPIASSFWDVVRGNPISSNGEPKNKTPSIPLKKSKYFNFNL
ncbi:protein odr-4 homolog [Phalaenopsis equestris]|uniref:protein odr-4 homolog n=1 Tax=Phalaenopsis equestris TaxID=78828 RepID=UPI0009E3D6A2|nr:protein odr-4 homolog [Phalaenopsis equestris]